MKVLQGWAGAMCVSLLVLGGCSRSKSSQTAGDRLPVVASDSAALPGATDAADAPHAPSVAELPHADLTAYKDPATGVSFRYPSVWRPAAGPVLPAPGFTAVAGAARISQQFLPTNTALAATVLRGLSFSYTVQDGSDAAACAAVPVRAAAGASKADTVRYGSVTYTEAKGGDAAMCTHVQNAVDSTLRGSQCLIFERDLVTSCPYVKTKTEPRPLSEQETAALQHHLDAVMQSVEITSQ